MNFHFKSEFVNDTCLWGLIMLLVMSSCTNRTKESEKTESYYSGKCDLKVIDVPESMASCTNNINTIPATKDDIVALQDEDGKATLSQISMFEIGDDYIGLYDSDNLYCYSLPSGQLKGMVSAKGESQEEYSVITDATISKDETFHVLVSKWQNSESEIKVYNRNNEFIKSIKLPGFYGDICSLDSTDYILTGAINSSGGIMPVVKYNSGVNVKIDTLFIGKSFAPKTTFFQTLKIYRRQPSISYFESGDTIYSMTRSNSKSPQPTLFLDYKGLKYKNPNNKPIHENNDNGILLTDISLFENNIYARLEKGGEISYLVYDINNGSVIYGMKVNPQGKYGLSFNIEGTEFSSWPISYWDGNLLFPIPKDVMSKLFKSDEVNPSLLIVPVERLAKSYTGK